MEQNVEAKIREVNTILKYMKLPINFRFACFDLKHYEPSMVLKDTSFKTDSLACEVTENGEVVFFFKHYPSVTSAKNYAEYEKNKDYIRKLDTGINMLNSLHLKVPKYDSTII